MVLSAGWSIMSARGVQVTMRSGRWQLGAQGSTLCFAALLLLALASATSTEAAAASSCDSGILQMKPFPSSAQDADTSCFYATPLSTNSIKAICGLALRVRVTDGIVKIVPLEQGTYKINSVGPGPVDVPFNCKDMNASGLFYPGSTTRVSVMLYDNFGGPLSNLTKTGPNQISLTPGHINSYKGPPVTCVYNYTVTEGCVLGVKAPAKPAAACPAAYYKQAGRFNKSYCTPCPPGTYASKAGAACKPCAPGTYNSFYGAKACKTCGPTTYAPSKGATSCQYCDSYSNNYTDGLKCSTCPKGSVIAADYKPQCLKCQAGKKCCTVGWGKDCPKCAAGSAANTITSIFALESATPSSCLATSAALCAPKINITVDGTCTITIDNLENMKHPARSTYCPWSTAMSQAVPIKGAQFRISDIAKFDYYGGDNSLLSGNFTSAASPYLNVYIPPTKCTLRYRALTAPVAAILGAAPKPGKATTCPAGQYLETQTDAKPGPCLPCPPSSYSAQPSRGRTCIPCPAGTYTDRYGSTKCRKCPAGWVAPRPGAASCQLCDGGRLANPDRKTCVACPKDSSISYIGTLPRCLGNAYGNICCASGECKGQTPCKGPRKSTTAGIADTYTATFQIIRNNVRQQPACKNATFLSCLPLNGKLQAYSSSGDLSLRLEVYRTNFTCANYVNSYSGGYIGTKSAYLTSYENSAGDNIAYGLVSHSSKGTVTMYLSPYEENEYVSQVPPPTKATADCSMTLRLLSGYAFDLIPPAGAACDPSDVVVTYQGRKFCQLCPAGQFKNSRGLCQDCPAGYYSDKAGAQVCEPCPPGYNCFSGFSSPSPCGAGSYSSKPKQERCKDCPANTYGSPSYEIPNTKCNACPKGTVAPKAATACGVPWDKTFPA